MSRFSEAPADGGISYTAQEDEARERAEELEREAYLLQLDHDVRSRVKDLFGLWRNDGSSQEMKTAGQALVWWALREGVRRAESGQHAEWILETEK